jgi:hypothetical protein
LAPEAALLLDRRRQAPARDAAREGNIPKDKACNSSSLVPR